MSSNFKYNSYGNSIDGTTYCSGTETVAQNLIEDNEGNATIIFPSSNSWISVRSMDYRITDENGTLILPLNIYKIKSLNIKVKNAIDGQNLVYFTNSNFTTISEISDFRDAEGNTLDLESIDISYFICDETTYSALPTYKSSQSSTRKELNKANAIPYQNNIIDISRYRFNKPLDKGITWQLAIASEILNGKLGSTYYVEHNGTIEHPENKYYLNEFTLYYRTNDSRDLKFRVEYIPISTNTKLRARKSAKTKQEYMQPFNQRAEINSTRAFGKSMYLSAQRTGVEEVTIVKIVTKVSDILPLGCRVKHDGKHYILIGRRIDMTNTVYLKVTYTLSQNWSSRSRHVAVDQKYRNYKIPQDILWRNLYWEDYVEVTADGVVTGANPGSLYNTIGTENGTVNLLPQIFMCDSSNDVTVTSFFLYKLTSGVTAPCTTMGVANSMVFSASMQDNLSAGLRISPTDSQYCEEVYYCNEDGTLSDGYVRLAAGINNSDESKYPASSSELDTAYNSPKNTVFNVHYNIDKDAGEALKFTYQCHFVSDDPDIVIGNKIAENHPLVKSWSENRKFRFWALFNPIRQGVDKIYPNEGIFIELADETAKQEYFTVSDCSETGANAFKINVAQIQRLAVAWAITDENNNLYIGCNDITKSTLYFTHIHKRKQGGIL